MPRQWRATPPPNICIHSQHGLPGGWPGFEVSKSYFSYETYALALPRDDGAFRLLVDRTLAQLYRSGKINAILEKTFGKGQPPEMLKAMILINSLPDK